MPTLDTLLERNQDFASHHFQQGLPLMPTLRAMLIGCVDPRVDPAHLLGLQPGEVVVIRNIGGRVTPTTLQTIGMLGRVAQAEGGRMGGPGIPGIDPDRFIPSQPHGLPHRGVPSHGLCPLIEVVTPMTSGLIARTVEATVLVLPK